MHTIYNRDRALALNEAAAFIANELKRFANRQVVLGLPGGRSAAELFVPLAEAIAKLDINTLRQLRIYLIDERCVPLSSDESNAYLVDEELIQPLVEKNVLSRSQFRAFIYRHDLPDWGVSQYQDDFLSQGGKFDVAVLAAGEDGHIASLFPGHPAWSGTAGEAAFITVDNSPKPPPRRISASPAVLQKSGSTLLLFLGEEKRSALKAFNSGADIQSCPARIVAGVPHLCVVTDLEES